MNRRDLLKMIPGATAALAFFKFRKGGYIVAGVDPASPDGDYAGIVTMVKTPEGHVVVETFATNDISILSGEKKVSATNGGKITFSKDGGQTWEEANPDPPGFLYNLLFIKEDKA